MNVNHGIPAERRFKHLIGLAVHNILWNDWDPIGVNSCGPDDEYDAYVWPVISKVMQGASPEEVEAYLEWACNEHMECPQAAGKNLELARSLCALRPEGDVG